MNHLPREAVDRRRFLTMLSAAGAATLAPSLLAGCAPAASPNRLPAATSEQAALQTAAKPQGSGEPIKLGFIALTDCASVVMAQELGLFKEYGLNVDLIKQASWASTRDNLLTGEIHGAHCLFGMPFSVYTGVGGQAGKELHIAMVLNNNGQAITLSKDGFAGKVGHRDLSKVRPAVEALQGRKEVTFAMTFPGGTHDMWLRYWLAAAGVDAKTVRIITIPPPQMVANMKVGNMDGFCVGEPWNGVAVKENIGFTTITTQELWKNHPEKALVVNPEFAGKRRDDLKLVMRAVIEASRYIDDPKNKSEAAKVIGRQAYVNANADVIDARLAGRYELGGDLGQREYKDDTMLFYNNGLVNAPRRAHAYWFMTQYARFGYLKGLPDLKAITDKLVLLDLYKEVAKDVSVPLPDDDMAPFSVNLDAVKFDPADAPAYLKSAGGGA